MEAVALALGAVRHPGASEEEIKTRFVREMNNKADLLGMKNTYYFNVTGLDETEVKGGAYGTARDMAVLFNYILREKPALFESTKDYMATFTTLEENIHVARNTNAVVYEIPGIKGSKTGYTNIAGGNLVVAFDPELGRPIIVAVLGSSEEGRFRDVTKLVKATMERIKNSQPTTNNQQ
jgi:D-alanyl-D-alanine carboxypeptidase (penicillin-binding protein 5/6)